MLMTLVVEPTQTALTALLLKTVQTMQSAMGAFHLQTTQAI